MPSGSLTSAKHDDPQHFSLSQVSVQSQITGPLASVTVHQRFSSGLEEPGDALYRFAIPASAELISFQLKAAKRVLVSQVREVQSTFSVTQAQQFHLLCPEADGTIQVRVENLPVGEEVVVEFQYLQWLNVEGPEYVFRYPNVSADQVEIRVNVEGGSTHVWSYKGWAEGPFEVRLPAEPGLFLTQEHFMVALPPSALPASETPRDLVFVLDRTVSMDGARKRSARGAISRVMRNMGDRERFALWGLDRQWEWFRQGKFNGPDQVAAAESWLDAMPTSGGIAVAAVLERLMALKEESGRRLWAVIISDGPVEFDESIITQLQEKAPECRLSFLQIDGPTGDPLLPYVTRLGGGSYQRVPAAGGADEAALWMERESRSALQHLQPVDRGLNFLSDSLVPDRLSSPNGNEIVLLFGRKLGIGGLELRWDDGKLALEPKLSTNRGVGISWARERINVLQGRLRARPSLRAEAQKEISRLALQYGLSTSHTALVLQPEGVKDKSVAWAPPGWDGNQTAPEAPLSEQLRSLSEETPIVRVANLIISQAIVDGASHVHLQSHNGSCSVLYRVDGVLHPVMQPPNYLMPALLARLRIMAGLQPEPARTTRCGLIELDFEGRAARLEVLTCPSDRGEKMVLTVRRLPDSEQLPRLDLLSAGWKEGLVLVVGPVRSGVTTTLRRLLRNATHWGKNIVSTTNEGNNIRCVDHVSLEDTALPHGLDCDGWMVGTLRSPSLALAAVEAASEGRLVIAGINATSRAQAIRRLVQMGVDEELLESTLVGVVEQRMVRRLCSDCSPGCGVMGTGCERCGNTGYRGRLALVGPTLADLRMQADRYHEQGVVDRAEVDRVLPTK